MRLEFQLCPNLPRLAWAASLRIGDNVVRILHGPWVEIREDCFFEGAWDGPFESCRFDQALTFLGSGGCIAGDGIVFAGPTHIYDRLYSVRVDDQLVVSNSLAFSLALSGQRLDPKYSHYYLDFLDFGRSGIRVKEKRLRLAGPRFVELHDCCSLAIKPDLTVSRIEKPLGPSPRDYDDYVSFLLGTAERVFANARDAGRRFAYRPVTMLSTGYDTTAVSTLASKAGCREAVTFRKSNGHSGYEDDSGRATAPYLGLTITEYERMDYEKLLSGDDEFYIEPRSIDKTLAVMEKQIAGSILLTGRFGEWLWPRERCRNWGIRGETGHPLLQVPGRHKLGGCALGEFRLRTGFIDFPLLCSGALHAPAIQAITESGAMNQWSVPGGYNRPIARRIAEEAGVPRHLFGQSKKGGPRVRGGERRSGVRLLIYSLWEAAYWPPLRILILRLTGNRLNPAWRKGSFTVQRGAERIMQRYLAAVSAAEACAPAMPAR